MKLSLAVDGCAWRSAFEGAALAAMADLLDWKDRLDQGRLMLIGLRRWPAESLGGGAEEILYRNRAERYIPSSQFLKSTKREGPGRGRRSPRSPGFLAADERRVKGKWRRAARYNLAARTIVTK